ncbi:hypothetical protein H6G41_09665 [Tolypothrix sp. FACHB-123]|uniref:hypothetical protein n=1 Tax=Tolypothrix sp. FACHB-123 TaxID=2692868 RepID=UPI001683A9F0|nr:hypothetical protein [Tolypothrix sp. FACHB-123]MBD2354886.1 hypothetical protein [Tolypothrix sp. FACHB-123]
MAKSTGYQLTSGQTTVGEGWVLSIGHWALGMEHWEEITNAAYPMSKAVGRELPKRR